MNVITADTIVELLSHAGVSPRQRANLNLHTELSDPTNRFLNAGMSGTYVRPHRHRIGKWELVIALQGAVDLVIFTTNGVVKDRVSLGSNGVHLAEIEGGEWHSIVFHAPAAVALEVKPGPYEPEFDKEFATWAPPENDPGVVAFVGWLKTAAPGERTLKH
jgi:cupin fold WbuC family metalloprotein